MLIIWAVFSELPIQPKIDFPFWKLGWGTLCSFYFVHWTYFWLLFLCSMRERDFIQVSESDGDEIRENGDAYLQKIKEKATSNKCLVYPSISMSSQEVKGESRWWLGGNHGQCTEVWFDSFLSGRCIFIEMVDHGQLLVQESRSTRTKPAGRRWRKKILL